MQCFIVRVFLMMWAYEMVRIKTYPVWWRNWKGIKNVSNRKNTGDVGVNIRLHTSVRNGLDLIL